ncbi:MAG: DUF4286 family protein [Flavobacteriales bacterium]|nr:DUF4286 family protein [Flavobacteriales bacterium]
MSKIIYSVTVKVDSEVEADWLQWMQNVHIPDVMNTGFFLENKMSRVIGETEEGTSFNIQYICESMKSLHQYQVKDAQRLQVEHTQRYEGKFVAFRTLLEVLEN